VLQRCYKSEQKNQKNKKGADFFCTFRKINIGIASRLTKARATKILFIAFD
jgi:hypothetical protein